MNRSEFQVDVVPRLADLAEAFDRRPLGDAALRVWAEALQPLPSRHVLSVLLGWSRSRSKFPIPAEVYAAANELDTGEREKRIADEHSAREREVRHMGATSQGREALAMIRQVLQAKAGEQKDSKAWARKILDRYADRDTSLSDVAFRFACEALHVNANEIEAMRSVLDKR